MSQPENVCTETVKVEDKPKEETATVESEIGLKEALEKIADLEAKLKEKTEECSALKTQNSRLELDVVEANMKSAIGTNEHAEVHKMKEESEELLTRAKSIIFEKVKVCKNQELQIEALNAQVSSLKDVVSITKNLLEIRNVEVGHLQDQIDAMNGKVNAEKERQDLVHKKLENMIRMNADLKREYETQLCLFNALRERYSERELAKNVVEQMRNGTATPATASNSSTSTEASTEASTESTVKKE